MNLVQHVNFFCTVSESHPSLLLNGTAAQRFSPQYQALRDHLIDSRNNSSCHAIRRLTWYIAYYSGCFSRSYAITMSVDP